MDYININNFDEVFLKWVKTKDKTYIHYGFSQFVVMGNFLSHKFPHLIHHIYTPHINEAKNYINNNTHHFEALNWIPPAIHYWYYSKYLGSTSDYIEENIYIKYNGKWIALAQDLVFRGNCLKMLW